MAQSSTNTSNRSLGHLTTLEDLYVEQLRDLYSAETQIIKALPKMINAAGNAMLRDGFSEHLEQTREHAQRLEQIFDRIGQDPGGHTCRAMQGLIEEGAQTIEQGVPSPVLDAALIAAAQRIEHYEISGYGTTRALAQQLGDKDSVDLLQQTLDEEAETDAQLTQVAERVLKQAGERL